MSEGAPAGPSAYPVRTCPQGFVEPMLWPDDGGLRRETVLDSDYLPPRVVRRVGWRKCLRCRAPFFSKDVVRQRLCARCKGIGHGGKSQY